MKLKVMLVLTALLVSFILAGGGTKTVEKGTYIINIGGKDVGYNTYILTKGKEKGYESRAQTVLNLPQGKVVLTTDLKLSEKLTPIHYQLKATLPGQKQSIETTIKENKAKLLINVGGKIKKTTTKLTPPCYIMDSSMVDHWCYFTKRLDPNSVKEQKINIFVPRSAAVTDLVLKKKKEKEIKIGGKSYKAVVMEGVLASKVKVTLYIEPKEMKLLKMVIPEQNFSAELSSRVKPIK
ncbi:MAG: hypothetical protein J7L64_01265 [Acidobacteria bacterium]|nr:hypothetical protein [Acidobacteriota bacterium]